MKNPYLYCEIQDQKIIFSYIEWAPTATFAHQKEYPLSFQTFTDCKLFNSGEIEAAWSSFKESRSSHSEPSKLILSCPFLATYFNEEETAHFQVILFASLHLQPPFLVINYSLLSNSPSWEKVFSHRITTFEPPSWMQLIKTWTLRCMSLGFFFWVLALFSDSLDKTYKTLQNGCEEKEAWYGNAVKKSIEHTKASIPFTHLTPLAQWNEKSSAWYNNPSFLCSILSACPLGQGWLTSVDYSKDTNSIIFQGHLLEESAISPLLHFLEEKTGILYSLENFRYDPSVASFVFKIKGTLPNRT